MRLLERMNLLAHCSLLCLALTASWNAAAAPDPSLAGCWRAVKIVQSAPDGTRMEDTSGRCTLRFTEDQLASTCATASRPVTSTYRYEIVRPGVYLATMVASTFGTSLVGSSREYEYRVDGDRLTTASQLPATAGAGAGARVETQASRTACP